MANATVVSSANGSFPGGTTTVNAPTGIVAENLLLAFYMQDQDGSFASMLAPTATGTWTEAFTSAAVASTAGYLKIFYKYANVLDSQAVSYVWPGNSNATSMIQIFNMRDVKRGNPFAFTPVFFVGPAVSTVNLTAPVATSPVAGLELCFWSFEGAATGNTIAPPAGFSGTSFIDTGPFVVALVGTRNAGSTSGTFASQTAVSTNAGVTSSQGYLTASVVIGDDISNPITPWLKWRTPWKQFSTTYDLTRYIPPVVSAVSGGVTQTVTESSTVAGVLGTVAGVTQTVTESDVVAGIVGSFGSVTQTVTAAGTVTGTVSSTGATTQIVTAGFTVIGVVGSTTAITQTVTAGSTVTGNVSSMGAATQTVTVASVVTGTMAATGATAQTVTAGGTVTSTVGKVGSVNQVVTAGSTVSGVVGKVGSVTQTVTASGTVSTGLASGVTATVTTGSTVAGFVAATGSTTQSITAGAAVTGAVAGTRGVNATVTAAGTVAGVVGTTGVVTSTVVTGSAVTGSVLASGYAGAVTATTTAGASVVGVVGLVGSVVATVAVSGTLLASVGKVSGVVATVSATSSIIGIALAGGTPSTGYVTGKEANGPRIFETSASQPFVTSVLTGPVVIGENS